ncbi:MAG: hypothetical protein ACLTYN_16685 [Dysosmobacter welbionis]
MVRRRHRLRREKALVLGSGRTSVTVKAALEQLGADVTVISAAVRTVRPSGPPRRCQIIVNTTPVGMYPHSGRRWICGCSPM